MAIRVVHMREPGIGEPCDVYIGRAGRGAAGSPLANPFKVKPHGPYERGETIELYRGWLERQIAAREPTVCAELNRLHRVDRSGDLRLRCFCAPRTCHGDVVKEVLERARPRG